MVYSKYKKIIFPLFILITLFLISGCAKPNQEQTNISEKSPTPILSIYENSRMIEIKGINCDHIALMSPNKLYMANIRFIKQLENEATELVAEYDDNANTVSVILTVDRSKGGTIEGPQLIFVVDCENSKIVDIQKIAYKNENITLDENKILSLGKLSAKLIHLSQVAYDISNTWTDIYNE